MTALDHIASALAEVKSARSRALKCKSRQLTQREPLDFIASVCHAWFRNHRPVIIEASPVPELLEVDTHLRSALEATARATSRATYKNVLTEAVEALVALQSAALVPLDVPTNNDVTPTFSSLATDPAMQAILVRRWEECQKCLRAGAFLAATIMMGGLLEALFVARANRLPEKAPLFKAKKTPLDARTKKPIPLADWTLRPYIDVGHELGWITKSGADVAAILRDYRNYVHPEKERSHGVTLGLADAEMFWTVTKSLVQQLLTTR